MKFLILAALSIASVYANAAATVLYCGGHNMEGASIKVLPDSKTMCVGAGPWTADYCNPAAKTYAITQTRTGSVKFAGKDFTFTEYVGTSADKVQVVRAFDQPAPMASYNGTVHHADLMGDWTMLNSVSPDLAAKGSEPVCYRGPDDAF